MTATSARTTPEPGVLAPPDDRATQDRARSDDRARRGATTQALLDRLANADDHAEHERLVDELVLVNLGVAHAIATRYRGRGLGIDDLEQVARLGLVKAAQGFDTTRQNDFLAYAVPTIRGEVRKHFRDQGWMVRPPRRVQELQSRIVAAAETLTQTLARSPRPSEIADLLEVPLEDVHDALAAEGCFSPSSLDRPVRTEGGTALLGDLLPDLDAGPGGEHDAVEARLILGPAVRRLSDRDRRILHLRFFNGWTQEEIARDIGVTQMHVSRLLSRILDELRTELA